MTIITTQGSYWNIIQTVITVNAFRWLFASTHYSFWEVRLPDKGPGE